MLSRRQYQELMGSYGYALELLLKVEESMDEDWPTVVSAGGDCRQRWSRLMHLINEVSVEMRRSISHFEANAEVE